MNDLIVVPSSLESIPSTHTMGNRVASSPSNREQNHPTFWGEIPFHGRTGLVISSLRADSKSNAEGHASNHAKTPMRQSGVSSRAGTGKRSLCLPDDLLSIQVRSE
jgi:hypothetical protein